MPKPKISPPAINQTAIGDGNVQVVGDNNTINQTFIQKVFKGINIVINKVIRGDGETLDQRNRRILLNHVENFWVKGVLEKSLYGEVLIELGMKEEPRAVKTYPWGIKRENTGETLPAGTTMLEIFEQIGLGRSLLILGAPGSGKTTMLLELARQLIERARKDETEPIPMVFNLASWTEKQTLADWLARELNVIYYVPKKIAPGWVKENKLLLLLDGLDEVRQESREQCVETINQFRQENGLISLAVCSRGQDYANLKAKLSLDSAIEIQPLTPGQVDEYFEGLGDGLAGVRETLEKDTALREMAGTPLFLSIIIIAYRGKGSLNNLRSDDIDVQRKQLLDTYIIKMFQRSEQSKQWAGKAQDVMRWLSWLARKMIKHDQIICQLERIQPEWLDEYFQRRVYYSFLVIFTILLGGSEAIAQLFLFWRYGETILFGLLLGIVGFVIFISLKSKSISLINKKAVISPAFNFPIEPVSKIQFAFRPMINSVLFSAAFGVLVWLSGMFIYGELRSNILPSLLTGIISGTMLGLIFVGPYALIFGMTVMKGVSGLATDKTITPNQGIQLSLTYCLLTWIGVEILAFFYALFVFQFLGIVSSSQMKFFDVLLLFEIFAIPFGFATGLFYGGFAATQHYSLRLVLARNNILPWRLVPFLDYCCDLIFLRRVGGGYIFVHRLLMEHFAEMHTEKFAPKESQ